MSTPPLSRRRVCVAVAALCALGAPLAQAQIGLPEQANHDRRALRAWRLERQLRARDGQGAEHRAEADR